MVAWWCIDEGGATPSRSTALGAMLAVPLRHTLDPTRGKETDCSRPRRRGRRAPDEREQGGGESRNGSVQTKHTSDGHETKKHETVYLLAGRSTLTLRGWGPHASALAFARNLSKVFPFFGGLMANTIPAGQWGTLTVWRQ